MFDHFGRQRNERVFRERTNPLEEMTDEQLRSRFRFCRESIQYILEQIKDEISPSTSRSHAISAELQVKCRISSSISYSFASFRSAGDRY